MRKLACAGAIAFATVGSMFIAAPGMAGEPEQIALQRASTLSERDIVQIKQILRLTPEQERLWSPFAVALRDFVRKQQQGDDETAGIARRAANHAAAVAGSAARYKRLAAAAAPLIKSLDDAQRRDAMMLARAMGFAHLAAAF
jgi:zinc resistance-associated protein